MRRKEENIWLSQCRRILCIPVQVNKQSSLWQSLLLDTREIPIAVGQGIPQISLALLTSKDRTKSIFTPRALCKCSFSCFFLTFLPPPYIPLNTQDHIHLCTLFFSFGGLLSYTFISQRWHPFL